MDTQSFDTICALSSGSAQAAISLIRLSGPDAFKIAQIIFMGKHFKAAESQTLHFGKCIDPASMKTIDEVLLSKFIGPKSYTGEDMVEFSIHGSPYIQAQMIQVLIAQGARLANPGEFSQRAFLNGKMDLSQAEAVCDLISATTPQMHALALKQLKGGFSLKIKALRDRLIEFASLMELELDFSEEDVEFADRSHLEQLLSNIIEESKILCDSFKLGNAIKKGIPVIIVGAPNVGKSTLLNTLLNEQKAIVSDVAGTTRDVIEDTLNIKGISFRFMDTAGIRESEDKVEKIGIKKTKDYIDTAQIIINVKDHQTGYVLTEKEIQQHQNLIYVTNKSDLNPQKKKQNDQSIFISAKENTGIEELKTELLNLYNLSAPTNDQIVITSQRHYASLINALTPLEKSLEDLKHKVSGDLIAQNLRYAIHHLGEITGEISNEDLLDSIFSNFCIGK